MSHLENRAPLLLKVALRQAQKRLRDEAEALSQYEALAGNLGWDEVAEAASAATKALAEAAERVADTVEAAVRVQVEHAHAHEHAHSHSHTHEHAHEHDAD